MTSTAPLTASRRHLSVGAEQDLLIRLAGEADRAPLARLAALDSAPALTGEVLVAELDGMLAAAVSIATGRVVADPFRPTADVVVLLHARLARDGRRAGALRRVSGLAPARLRPV